MTHRLRPWPVRLYRRLLALYPRSFRQRFATDMVEMFADAFAERRRQGRVAVGRLLLKTFRDLIGNGLKARLRADAAPPDGNRRAKPRGVFVDSLLMDVRFAIRSLRRNSIFAAVTVLTLGLGIGANTAIFSVVNGVMLRPLPYPDAQNLVVTWSQFPAQNNPRFPMSIAEYLEYRKDSEAFTEMGAFSIGGVTVVHPDGAERVNTAFVTRSALSLLGASPSAGRLFSEAEDRTGGPRVAVLSESYWTSHYGRDPTVFDGTTLVAGGITYAIVGALPDAFYLPGGAADIYVPAQFNGRIINDRSGHFLTVVGRLAPRTPLATAAGELEALLGRWETAFEGQHTTNTINHPMVLVPLKEQMFGGVSGTLWILLSAVGLVLLLACANVANLLLARGEARGREIGMRQAIGAGRARLLRQLLTESVVLSLAGGAVGMLIGGFGTKLILALEPGNLPRVGEVSLDWRVLTFAFGISAATGVLFGALPAARLSRSGTTALLAVSDRGGSAGRPARRLLGALVVAQTTLATILLVGSGLLVKSFWILQRVDPGFVPTNRIGFDVRLTPNAYPDLDATLAYYRRLFSQLEAVPGVRAVASARGLPLRNPGFTERFIVEGRIPDPDGNNPSAHYQSATANYFAVMGTPLVAGREFTEADRTDASPVALINETAARMYFPDADPVGQRIRALFAGEESAWKTIVGVVGDMRYNGLDTEPRPELWLPHAQAPGGFGVFVVRNASVVVVSEAAPEGVMPAIRAAAREVDPDVPLVNLNRLDGAVTTSLAGERFVTVLLAAFAVVALTIAGVGVYGVVSFSVARRTRELGIRMALGSQPRQVVVAVLGNGVRLAGLGALVGLGIAAVSARVMESLVFGIGVRDVPVYAVGALLLPLVAGFASLMPARRASRVDPTNSLRGDG